VFANAHSGEDPAVERIVDDELARADDRVA